jgi:hypothetical protein
MAPANAAATAANLRLLCWVLLNVERSYSANKVLHISTSITAGCIVSAGCSCRAVQCCKSLAAT